MKPVEVQETIRFRNQTPHTVMVSVLVESDGKSPVEHTFGPIPPQGIGQTTIPIWQPGTFLVRATWPLSEGREGFGKFQVTVLPDIEITPLTLTMEPVFDDGLYGRFTRVEWDHAKEFFEIQL